MREDNKRKLGEQLIKCLLDEKIPSQVKFKKMDYIIRLGADINASVKENGFSILTLAKIRGDNDVIEWLEKNGAEIKLSNKDDAEKFFKSASVEEINKVLKVLPDGYELDCDVDLSERGLTELPDFSKVVVNGNFNCSDNQLTSLRGVPSKVGGDFNCSHNKLDSLEGAPREVGRHFDCSDNGLDSLEGAPRVVGRSFNCIHNKLKTLEGAPSKVGGVFLCSHNKLDSLEGAPSKVSGLFDCRNNLLVSLRGAPSEVDGDFDCSDNPLKSYKGKPDKITENFYAPSIEQVTNINGGNVR